MSAADKDFGRQNELDRNKLAKYFENDLVKHNPG